MIKKLIWIILIFTLFTLTALSVAADVVDCRGIQDEVGTVTRITKSRVGYVYTVNVNGDLAFIHKLGKYTRGHEVIVSGLACYTNWNSTYRKVQVDSSSW
jgi:hypothetical protein